MKLKSGKTYTGKTFDQQEAENLEDVTLIRCKWNRLYMLSSQRIRIIDCAAPKRPKPAHNFIQLDKCFNSQIVGAVCVRDCPAEEDKINLFECVDCSVSWAWMYGRSSESGSGILIDKDCISCQVADSWAINTFNVGMGIAGGTANALVRCTAMNNQPSGGGNVGIYIALMYPGLTPIGSARDCRVCWWKVDAVGKRMGRNDRWTPDGSFVGTATVLRGFNLKAEWRRFMAGKAVAVNAALAKVAR